MKSYRQALLARVPPGKRKTRDLIFFYAVHTIGALIQKLEGGPPTPTPTRPAIAVTTEGSGTSAIFMVSGSQFLAGAAVAIRAARIGDGQIPTVFFNTTSTAAGTMQMRLPIPCIFGLQLSFSANDGRPDASDLTGTLWSNTVTVGYP